MPTHWYTRHFLLALTALTSMMGSAHIAAQAAPPTPPRATNTSIWIAPAELAIDYGVTVDERRPILVAQQQRRAHQLTAGGAGIGRSKFIATQAVQGAVCGASLAVIDPHEELAQDIVCGITTSSAHIHR